MRLKVKVGIITLVAVAVYAGLDYTIQRAIIVPSFQSLEREEARKDTQRCVEAIAREVHHLDLLCVDWAAWNDTYEYVADHNARFVADNMTNETFKANNLDLLLVIDANGLVVWGQLRNPNPMQIDGMDDVRDLFLATTQRLVSHRDLTSCVKGIARTRIGPVLVASRPIITSDHTGPIRGTLIMGRLLDDELEKKLSEQTCVAMKIWSLQRETLDAPHVEIAGCFRPGMRYYLRERDDDALAAYSLVNGIHGTPALMVEAIIPRNISKAGHTASMFAMISILAVGAVMLALILVTFQRTVIGPVSKLTRHVMDAGAEGSPSLPESRRDELGILARQFDSSFQELQNRDRLLRGVVTVGQCFMSEGDLATAFTRALEALGQAARVDRVSVLRKTRDLGGGHVEVQRAYEWIRPGATKRTDGPGLDALSSEWFPGWREKLAQGQVVFGLTDDLPPSAREVLGPNGVLSVVVVPIRVEGAIWGVISLDDCTSRRQWTQGDLSILEATANLTGAVILREQARAGMIEASQAAESANAAKGEFLARMSHEIRTPMNGVIGMTGLLMSTPLSEQQKRYSRIIRSSAEALLTLINDILDFSKIEAGKMDLRPSDFDLMELVENVAEMLSHQAAGKKIELTTFVDPSMPALLRGDADRLRQIMVNLVGNAIKFTDHGEVDLRSEVKERNDSEIVLGFSVRDTGIGIDPERQSELFQSFRQIDGSNTRRFGGTGLGLAICKRLVEMMGGQIGLTSRSGEGSTFWFTARLGRVSPQQRIRPVSDRIARLRVLTVDKSAANRQVLVEQLACWGFTCQTASNGKEAIDILRRATADGAPFGIVIADALMSPMSGLEFASAVRADASICSNVRIIMTRVDAPIDPREAAAAGVAACLTKPVRQSKLFDAIADAMAAGEARTAPAPAEPGIEGLSAKAASKGAAILVAEDNDVNRELACEILKAAGYRHDLAKNGLEAVDAVIRNRYDLVLMDCQMPQMDGLEATAIIRRKESLGRVLARSSARLPIVALTANAMVGEQDKCLQAGMDGYVAKPISPETLVQEIERCLRMAGASPAPAKAEDDSDRAASASAPAALADDASSSSADADAASRAAQAAAPAEAVQSPGASPIDLTGFLGRCMGNAALASKVLETFRRGASEQLQLLRGAIARCQAREAAVASHTIKGMAANLSAGELRQASLELEQSCRQGRWDLVGPQLAAVADQTRLCLECVPALLSTLAAGSNADDAQGNAMSNANRLSQPVISSDAKGKEGAI